MKDMRAWIGCLACYNEGRLVGEWYDADEASDVTIERVHQDGGALLTGLGTADAYRWSPGGDDAPEPEALVDNHEEIWVFDHEGFGGLIDGECSPYTVARIWD